MLPPPLKELKIYKVSPYVELIIKINGNWELGILLSYLLKLTYCIHKVKIYFLYTIHNSSSKMYSSPQNQTLT